MVPALELALEASMPRLSFSLPVAPAMVTLLPAPALSENTTSPLSSSLASTMVLAATYSPEELLTFVPASFLLMPSTNACAAVLPFSAV